MYLRSVTGQNNLTLQCFTSVSYLWWFSTETQWKCCFYDQACHLVVDIRTVSLSFWKRLTAFLYQPGSLLQCNDLLSIHPRYHSMSKVFNSTWKGEWSEMLCNANVQSRQTCQHNSPHPASFPVSKRSRNHVVLSLGLVCRLKEPSVDLEPWCWGLWSAGREWP